MSAARRAGANYGVQATTVNADVLGVGDHATATKTVYSGEAGQQARESIAALHKAVLALPLCAEAHAALEEDINSLTKAAEAKETNPQLLTATLTSITGKLKMVGIVAKDIAAVASPIMKLAGVFGLQLPW